MEFKLLDRLLKDMYAALGIPLLLVAVIPVVPWVVPAAVPEVLLMVLDIIIVPVVPVVPEVLDAAPVLVISKT
jgi:hypothetical protein